MTKREFLNKYRALSEQSKQEIKKYYEDLYKGAIFMETLELAEQRLLWILTYLKIVIKECSKDVHH